jgi:transcription elongation factor Elf1
MKINKRVFEFFKSTTTVLVLSSLVGLASVISGQSFLPPFILALVAQYVLFSVIASTINNYFAQQTKQKELDKLESLSTILECAACNAKNIVTFLPEQNERFEFECENCKSKNVVNINFVVAKVTEFADPIQVSSKI